MKPKQTLLKKKETARRKNQIHWIMHKNEISVKGNERKFEQFKQCSSLPQDFCRLQIDDSSHVTNRSIDRGI